MAETELVRIGEWLTITAAILGPVLAVQAQKWVERDNAKQAMKDQIFKTLMATRAARLSQTHVEALNMIPIAFYGRRLFGSQRQSKAEKRVTVAWRDYLAHLSSDATKMTQSQQDVHFNESNEKFINLLHVIAIAQRFDFEPVDLRSGYSPVHHNTIDAESEAIRAGLAQIVSGRAPLPMRIVDWPAEQSRPQLDEDSQEPA